MKLICILLITAIMQVSASSFGQTVSLSKQNITMKEVLNSIQSQTGYSFIISSELLKESGLINVSLKNVPLTEALDKCFEGKQFDYIINKRTIIVNRKKNSEPRQNMIRVTGKITDGNKQPLPGVSVKIKNSTSAVISNNNGIYHITVPSQAAVLVFSYVGYTTQEVSVDNKIVIDILLKEKPTGLDEVFVIGYGTVKKADLTGAVSSVNMADLNKAPVASFDQALAGRIAGVQVSSNEGQPGNEGVNIVIRGNGSLTQSNAPLFVIDGFPMEDFNTGSLNNDDIESINVLKDASATAIYGARGANGVIIIETKKGKTGMPVLSYNGSYGLQQVNKLMEMMSPYDFVKYQVDRNNAATYLDNGYSLESYKNAPSINWQEKLFQTGNTQIHNIALRGGNAKTKYAISGSMFGTDGVIINTGYKRYQGRVSVEQNISPKINSSINVNYSNNRSFGQQVSVGTGGSTSYLLYATWAYRPVTGNVDYSLDDLASELGDDAIDPTADYRINPIVSALNEYIRNNNANINASANLVYTITPELTLKLTGGYNHVLINNNSFFNSQTQRGTPLIPTNIRGQWGAKVYAERNILSNENTINYRKRINKDNYLDLLGGFSTQRNYSSGGGFTSINVPNEQLGINGLSQGTPLSVTSPATESTLMSFLSRANYNYKSRYLFTVTFRADGSSKFSNGNKWGYFPSGAFAWRIVNEPFLKRMSFISDAKLRMSYGLTGNNRVNDFAYFPTLNTTNAAAYSFNNGNPLQGVIISNLGNSALRWETTVQTDIGFDLSLLKNRIEINVDLYKKVTKDLLLNADMPYNTGYSSVYKNIGKMQNQGLEFSLNTTNIQNKVFKWQSNFNISFNRNKILALTDGQKSIFTALKWDTGYNNSNLYISEVGQPAGQFYGFIWDGNYQYNDFDQTTAGAYVLKADVPNNGNARANIQPGHIKYKDINADGLVNASDQAVIGNALPLHTGGFTNNFSYKNFDLGVFLQWSYGNKIYNANRLVFEGAIRSNVNQFAAYANRWTPENQSSVYYSVGGQGPSGTYSSRVIEDGSYLRLKTVSLAYNLPSKCLKSIHLTGLNFNISAQNLFTFTSYSGMDPEVSTQNSVLTPGFDYSAYPHARTIVLGIKANL